MGLLLGDSTVSIHASAWEATPVRPQHPMDLSVSIHASAWEATLSRNGVPQVAPFQSTPPHGRRRGGSGTRVPPGRFNPRLRMGGDPHSAGNPMSQRVSIHASAWEATKPLSV